MLLGGNIFLQWLLLCNWLWRDYCGRLCCWPQVVDLPLSTAFAIWLCRFRCGTHPPPYLKQGWPLNLLWPIAYDEGYSESLLSPGLKRLCMLSFFELCLCPETKPSLLENERQRTVTSAKDIFNQWSLLWPTNWLQMHEWPQPGPAKPPSQS